MVIIWSSVMTIIMKIVMTVITIFMIIVIFVIFVENIMLYPMDIIHRLISITIVMISAISIIVIIIIVVVIVIITVGVINGLLVEDRVVVSEWSVSGPTKLRAKCPQCRQFTIVSPNCSQCLK